MHDVPPVRQRSSVNLRAIARQAGVSVSTVSRALRDALGVDAETRQRVLEVAERSGYRPPLRSQYSRACRTLSILVLARGHSPGMVSDLMTGISRAAVEAKTTILSHQPNELDVAEILQPAHQPPALRTGSVDGILLLQNWPTEIAVGLARTNTVVSVLASHPDTDSIEIGLSGRIGQWIDGLLGSTPGGIGFFDNEPNDLSVWLCDAFREAAAARPGSQILIVAPAASSHQVEITLRDAIRRGVSTWVCADVTAALRFRVGVGQILGGQVRLLVPSGGRSGGSCLSDDLESAGYAAVRCMLQRLSEPREPFRTTKVSSSFSVVPFPPHPTP